MSTPNFKLEHASKIYAIHPDDWCESDLSYIASENGYDKDSGCDGDRSYTGNYFACKDKTIKFGDSEIYLSIRLKLVNGYYDGCNFDYDIIVSLCGFPGCYGDKYDYFDDDWKEELSDCIEYSYNVGLARMMTEKMANKIDFEAENMMEEAEKLFDKYCDNILGCVGVGSNGEAFYVTER